MTHVRLPARSIVLLVAESFDRVKPRGADRRDHAADQSDRAKDDDGDDQRKRVDHKAYVARFRVLGHGAVECESADGEGNHVREDDSEESANESDGERLGQKLEEDVRRRAPSAFSMPISRVRWVTATSMIFISPTPPILESACR